MSRFWRWMPPALPLLIFSIIDNPEKCLLLQDVTEPTNGEDVHIEMVADAFVLAVYSAREERIVVAVDTQFRERQQRHQSARDEL